MVSKKRNYVNTQTEIEIRQVPNPSTLASVNIPDELQCSGTATDP